ncbi:MAG: hypothetical protein KDK33_07385, partial [Leptospiraceae bacterium]|nr:hypothetical protein [Leptospiraceae bacterium]
FYSQHTAPGGAFQYLERLILAYFYDLANISAVSIVRVAESLYFAGQRPTLPSCCPRPAAPI